MKNQLRKSVFVLSLAVLTVAVVSCGEKKTAEADPVRTTSLMGKDIIMYIEGAEEKDYEAIDSIIRSMQSFFYSGDTGSVMARFNRWPYSDSLMTFTDPENTFVQVYDYLFELHRQTNGFFDPTFGPLAAERAKLQPGDSLRASVLDSLMTFCGLDQSFFTKRDYHNEAGGYEKSFLSKSDSRARIDLDGFAGAYTLDIIRYYLIDNDIPSFFLKWNNLVINQDVNSTGKALMEFQLPGDLGKQQLKIENRILATAGENEVKKILLESTDDPVNNPTTNTFVVSGSAAVAWVYCQAFTLMGPVEMQYFMEESPYRDIHVTMLFRDQDGYYAASTPEMDSLWVPVSHPDSLNQQP
jgi:thiamine biosynthesis lipoprotein ApbE